MGRGRRALEAVDVAVVVATHGRPLRLRWLLEALSEQDLVHAAMDISDGLSGDLQQICRESGLAAILLPDTVPVDAPRRSVVAR